MSCYNEVNNISPAINKPNCYRDCRPETWLEAFVWIFSLSSAEDCKVMIKINHITIIIIMTIYIITIIIIINDDIDNKNIYNNAITSC